MLDDLLVAFHLCYLPGQVKVPAVDFGEEDISTKVETKRQRKSRSARGREDHEVPELSLSRGFSGRDHSQTLLKQAFDDVMCQLKPGFF